MLRIVRLSLFAAGLIAVWIALLNVELDHLHHRLVLYSPVLAVLAFGFYSIFALLYGVVTFRTVPQEAESLSKEVVIAKADLARQGIHLSAD